MLKWERPSFPTGLMRLCFLSSLLWDPQSPWKSGSSPFLPAWQDAVLYLLHTCWINLLLILENEKSGLMLSSRYLCPGILLSFFIFPPSFFFPILQQQKLATVGRLPCKSTSMQAWQQAAADFWLQALFKILMPSPAVWYWKSGQFVWNCKVSYEICSACCPYHSCDMPIREVMPFQGKESNWWVWFLKFFLVAYAVRKMFLILVE